MKKKLIITSVIISLLLIIPQLVKGAELDSGDYAVTDTYISRINPETTVETFKTNLNATSMKIYKDSTKAQEVTNGNVGTDMCTEYEGKNRALSVIGDLNNDGKANQLDLSLMIRHILGFKDSQITQEMKKLSADITGDNNINNVDITALIRYNIFGEFYITVSAPEITSMTTSTTTDSVKITVSANNAENGIYQYSYKEEGESSYTEATKTKETSYTITGLKANTKYTVQVRVTNKYGMADKEEKEVTTVKKDIDITENGALEQAGEVTWSNGKATLKLSTNTGYTIEYQINETNGTWKNGNTVNDLNHGDIVYTRLSDGTINSNTKQFKIEDTVKPTITDKEPLYIDVIVILEVEATDNESGLKGNYAFYMKKENEPDSAYVKVQDSQSPLLFAIDSIEAYTKYIFKVEVEDNAGNVGVFTKAIETGQLEEIQGSIEQDGDIVWENGEATLKLKTNSKFTIQYQVNATETSSWITGNTITGLKHGDEVSAILTDGRDYADRVAIILIQDTTPPTITEESSSTTTSSFSIQVTATDNESGMPQEPNYVFYIKQTGENSETDDQEQNVVNQDVQNEVHSAEMIDGEVYEKVQEGTNSSLIRTELKQNTTYKIRIKVKDNAGNQATFTKELVTESIEGATSGLTNGSITATTPVWAEGKATITLSTTTNQTIEWQINNVTGEWTQGTTVTDLNHNDTVYARLTDGTNVGQEGSVAIKDTIVPENATINFASTTITPGQDLDAEVTLLDNQSGVDVASCKWIYNTDATAQIDESTYTGTFTTEKETLKLNVTSGGTYYLHILTVDKAGNKTQNVSTAVEVKQEATVADVKIGDYVNYTPSTVSSTIKNTLKSTLKTYTGMTRDYQTVTQEAGIKWRVLKVNDDTVNLISEAPLEESIYISFDPIAYNNIVYLLNHYCNVLYSNSSINANARSIKLQDCLEKVDKNVWDYTVYNTFTGEPTIVLNTAEYGSMGGSNYKYPYIWTQTKTANDLNKIDSTSITGTIESDEQNELTKETGGEATSSITVEADNITDLLTVMSANYFIKADTRDINRVSDMYFEIFVGDDSYNYWYAFADRYVDFISTNAGGYATWGLKCFSRYCIRDLYMYYSYGTEDMEDSHQTILARPIVSVPVEAFDFWTEYDEINGWTLKNSI